MEVFKDENEKYQKWVKNNPYGFVVNTRNERSNLYRVAHKTLCRYISDKNNPAQSTKNYIKVCATNPLDIVGWFNSNKIDFDGKFHECGICKPNINDLVNSRPCSFEDEVEMQLINSKEQLLKNIDTVESILADGAEQDKLTAYNLIKLGSCFVAYKVRDEVRFAPSRFIGYVDNNLNKHTKGKKRHIVDGRDTNPVISKILGKLSENGRLDKEYRTYCNSIGIAPTLKKRKFWFLELSDDFAENNFLDGEFPEGKIVERIHKARERNSKVIKIAKDNFKKKYGKLYCQVCEFDFEKKYGKWGKDFIEGHHTIAVSDMQPDHKTRPEDIAILCANCHRIVHKRRPWLSMSELSKLLKK